MAKPPRALRHTRPVPLAIETGASVAWLAAGSLVGRRVADHCTWCSSNRFDEGIRTALVMDNLRAPAQTSHVLSMGIAPLYSLAGVMLPAFSAGRADFALQDALIVGNSVAIATGFNQFAKGTFSRERPAWHHGRGREHRVRDQSRGSLPVFLFGGYFAAICPGGICLDRRISARVPHGAVDCTGWGRSGSPAWDCSALQRTCTGPPTC